MYIVINKTKRKDFQFTGNWPNDIIEYMLDNGDDIIVISTYSNTIKIPGDFSTEFEGEREWKEYTYHPDMFKEGE
jgi:hypothetical protein